MSGTRGRVLVVDDDAALAEMLGIVLRGEGFDPVFCADGEAALGAFRESRPDLELLDLMLPRRDGVDVCRAIRAESGTPIVMLIAMSDTVDIVVVMEGEIDLVHTDGSTVRLRPGTVLVQNGADHAWRPTEVPCRMCFVNVAAERPA